MYIANYRYISEVSCDLPTPSNKELHVGYHLILVRSPLRSMNNYNRHLHVKSTEENFRCFVSQILRSLQKMCSHACMMHTSFCNHVAAT